jgi:hypothetical protein
MRKVSGLLWAILWIGAVLAQTPPPAPGGRGGPPPVPRKHLLVIGMARGDHHGSTSNAVATFWKLGKESAVWDTEIKTDIRRAEDVPGSGEVGHEAKGGQHGIAPEGEVIGICIQVHNQTRFLV